MPAPPGSRPRALLSFLLILGALPGLAWSQSQEDAERKVVPAPSDLQTSEDWNRRLGELLRSAEPATVATPQQQYASSQEYHIGPEDLIEITVFEAPELNREFRVSARGEISLPLLSAVKAQGLTPQELEAVLQELLRRTFMKDPHVGVHVREMQSHPVSVFGAVAKPGVYQIRGTKTLVEILSMAEGLAKDAGNTVLVMREATFPGIQTRNDTGRGPEVSDSSLTSGAGDPGAASSPSPEERPQESLEINLKKLLESGEPQYNVPIYPGDIVKVARAGIVYVVGEVKKPGGFVLASNENISVLQALALAEGLSRSAAKSHARIIRTDEGSGERTEIPIDLGKILAGKALDPRLQPNDIVFVPNSAARSAFYRAGEAAISVVSGVIIWRR